MRIKDNTMGSQLNTRDQYTRAYMRYQEHLIDLIESEMKKRKITAYSLSKETGISQATLSLLLCRNLDVLTIPLIYSILLALDIRIKEIKEPDGLSRMTFAEQMEPIMDSYMDYSFSLEEKEELKRTGIIKNTVEIYSPYGVYKGIFYIHKISGLVSFCRTDNLKRKYHLSDEDILCLIHGGEIPIILKDIEEILYLDFNTNKVKLKQK